MVEESARLMALLRDAQVDYCVALHDRMPPPQRQWRALDHLHRGGPGALTVRWTLRAGLGYEAARRRHAPFRELRDPDPEVRHALAGRAADALCTLGFALRSWGCGSQQDGRMSLFTGQVAGQFASVLARSAS